MARKLLNLTNVLIIVMLTEIASVIFLISCGRSDGEATMSCGGKIVGGYCWYMGAANQSCDTTCASHAGYSTATLRYAGSDGDDTKCAKVLDALGVASTSISHASAAGFGLGCYNHYNAAAPGSSQGRKRAIGDVTTSADSYSDVYRVCACNE